MQHDLTQGSITRHLLGMAVFIGLGLLFQTLYFLIDLYFVGRIGPAALAGVGLAGVVFFLVMAASQMVAVGTMSLMARAIGAKDNASAETVYRQAMLLSVVLAGVTLIAGYAFGGMAMRSLSADPLTAREGAAYLHGFLPALALMFPTGTMGAALRSAGVVRPTMMIQSATVLLNALLAPVLIAGWGLGLPLGTFGAGLASAIAALAGFVGAVVIFGRVQTLIAQPMRLTPPDSAVLRRIVGIGFPAGAEFLLLFVSMSLTYGFIQHFGAEAQAGFGVGSRVMQAVFLPAMAIAFAVGPIAGQNYGAGQYSRVIRTVRDAAVMGSIIMLALTLICQWNAPLLVAPFAADAETGAIAANYLKIVSLIFLASGLAFTASGAFQALGDTRPSLIGGVVRLAVYAGAMVFLVAQPWSRLEHFWWAAAIASTAQAAVVILFLLRQLKTKLSGADRTAPAVANAE